MKVYVGFDSSEPEAYRVTTESLLACSGMRAEKLCMAQLRDRGLWHRVADSRGGQMFDFNSGAHCSTEFAISRFLVPILCQQGWALFVDSDVIFLADPRELLKEADSSKAVMCVQHQHNAKGLKMVNKIQQPYPRKNWSSVMLFNCDHPANRRLTLDDVNRRPGRDLHAFYWLSDNEIGKLQPEWNWLVNVMEKPKNPKIAHFTNGGPWLENWAGADHDELWQHWAERRYKENRIEKTSL